MKRCLAMILLLAITAAVHASLLATAARIFNDSSLTDAEVHARVSALGSYALEPPRGETLTFTHTLQDTIEAPFYVVVPPQYDNSRDWPLLVWLHGGVGAGEFYEDISGRLEDGSDYMLAADSLREYIHLYPLARHDCQWWNATGQDNILWQIRFVKDRFRIDDNRVFVSGASDGGSGSYFLAQTSPNDFAAFMPHIGMVSVGGYVTQQATYPINLRNRALRAVNNEFDGLYPARAVNVQISAIRNAGVAVNYATYGFGHDMDYWRDDHACQSAFMRSRVRDPFQPALSWECDECGLNSGVDWLAITKLDTTVAAHEWHETIQDSLLNERISFGFYPDYEFEGEGVLVDSLTEGETAARSAGMHAGDIIVAMNDEQTLNLDDLDHLKHQCARGDSFTLTVVRDGRETVLSGAFPPPEKYPAFYYDTLSGRVDAEYADNRFDLQTSRVAAFALKLHPRMVDFDREVEVWVNGQRIWRGKPKYDRRYMQRTFEENLDRQSLWADAITVEIPAEIR